MKRVLLVFVFTILFGLQAAPKLLKKEDIHHTMEELFAYHVEYKQLTPLIVKRSFKTYIETFDPTRTYLLYSEVKPFLELSDRQVEEIIQDYHIGSYKVYEQLNDLIAKAIRRARTFLEEMHGRLEPGEREVDASYAKEISQLQKRIALQYGYFLRQEGGGKEDSSDKRSQLYLLWKKRVSQKENSYLAKARQKEHFFAMHLLKAFATSLDSHTAYYSPEEALELKAALEKQFEGIGVVLREGIEGVSIIGIVKGGPADKSGAIEQGDLIEKIDGMALKGLSYEEVLDKLKGRLGEEVVLGLKRREDSGEEKRLDVHLTRDKIVMQGERVSWRAIPFADGMIGTIELPSFYEASDGSSCEKDLKQAFVALQNQGNLLGVVLDMRENSGGFLNQAVKVGSLFIENGVIVISKYSDEEVQYSRAVDTKAAYKGPLVILTSKASASAAEIIAQSLQDYGVAIIVGDERTYGKGSIQYQTVTESNAAAYFKVTVGRYYTVSGASTQIEGVKADIHLPTCYSPFRIGERYLEYPLSRDQLAPAFIDPLSDLSPRDKEWFEKNYLPYLHQKNPFWRKMLPLLKEDSIYRQTHNKDFLLYKQKLDATEMVLPKEGEWGAEDLQMNEAVRIVQDMILLETEHPLTVR